MTTKTTVFSNGKPLAAVVTQVKDTGKYVASLDTTDTTVLAVGDTREEAADNLTAKLSGK